MFFWSSLASLMIQQMLAIWSLVPLPFLKSAWITRLSCLTYKRSFSPHYRKYNVRFLKLVYLLILGFVQSSLLHTGFTLVVVARGVSRVVVHVIVLLLWRLLLLQSTGSRRTWAQELRCTGLAGPKHLRSFWTRDWTWSPCIGRRTLNQWTTRKVWHRFKSNVWKNWALPIKVINIFSGPLKMW